MLEVGKKIEIIETVGEDDTADKVVSGAIEVLATPIMIGWMEKASFQLAQKELEEGFTTVGTKVDIRHLKPTLKETEMKIVSELVEVDRRKLIFDVKVFEKKQDILVGEGIHTRFIVNFKDFYEKIK